MTSIFIFVNFKLKRSGNSNMLEIDLTKASFPPVIEESEACMEQVILAIKKARTIKYDSGCC